MLQSQSTTEVKALAMVLRDKLIADARQAMKAARELEEQYDLPRKAWRDEARTINARNSSIS